MPGPLSAARLLLGLGCLAVAPGLAQARGASWLVESERAGFTAGVGVGLGYQLFEPESGDPELGLIFPSAELSLGWFFNPHLALCAVGTFHRSVVHTEVFLEDLAGFADARIQRLGGVGALALDYWPIDALRARFGLGVSYLVADLRYESEGGERPLGGVPAAGGTDSDSGVGLLLGISVPFWNNQGAALAVGLDWDAGLYEGGVVHDLSLRFTWQAF